MSQHDTRLLFSIPGINAYHIQDGHESILTPSGPQTLSLLMVPTRSPVGDVSAGGAPEEDFYLHLNLPPELELPLPATTQIYHQPPHSYLIPRWDLGLDSHAFTRIEFPPLGRGVQQEDVDTFETILAQCTAFLEREPAPAKGLKGYNPADYAPGEGYASGSGKGGKHAHGGQIVLVDEENGSVVGELADDMTVVEDSAIKPGYKDPVEIDISADGKRISVKPLSEDYLELARHPVYQNSSIVQNAAAASRLIVTTSSQIANMLTSGAESFSTKTKPAKKPVVFGPATHNRARQINNLTASAASLSSRTVGQATKFAQNLGATVTRKGESSKKVDKEGYKPGILNKSMIAFSTIADGIATSGKHILASGGSAATHVVGHRWGDDARNLTSELASGVTNVGLVYIDVTGVSRKAVIKSVAKGMVVGKVKGGGTVLVGGGDGGELPQQMLQGQQQHSSSSSLTGVGAAAAQGAAPPGYSKGNYSGGLGEKYH